MDTKSYPKSLRSFGFGRLSFKIIIFYKKRKEKEKNIFESINSRIQAWNDLCPYQCWFLHFKKTYLAPTESNSASGPGLRQNPAPELIHLFLWDKRL